MLLSGLGKKFVLVTVFVFVVSVVFLVEPSAAPVTMPSNPSPAPEIVSVVVNHNPTWHPPTYTTHPYTGAVTVASPGRYLQTGTVDVTIKNKSFTPYTDKDGNYINVYYTFFIKNGGPVDDWSYFLENSGGPWYTVYQQSGSEYTVITFTYDGSGSLAPGVFCVIESGAVRSFYVQAVTGYFNRNSINPYYNSVYEGEGSLWSQFTITIPVSDKPVTSTPIAPSRPSTSSPSNPNNTPQQTPSQQSTLIIVIIVSTCIFAILLAVIVYQHKQRKTVSPTQTQPQ